MYFIYCDKPYEQSFSVNINRFGIKIYPLNKSQFNYIDKQYSYLYKSRVKIRNSIIKKEDGSFRFNYEKRKELEIDENLFDLIDTMRQNKKIPVFHKNIQEFLNHLIVLEIDSSKLSKYIDCDDFRVFIRQFINFYHVFDICSKKERKKEKEFSISYNMKKRYREKKELELHDVTQEIIIKYLLGFPEEEGYSCFGVNESFYDYLNIISKFLNTISNEELFKFIEIMEMYFTNSKLSQNNILNDTLIIESLLIKKESNSIEKEFVLKAGVIYKDSKLKKHYSNDDLSTILHFIYNIRSTIIHGSMEKIFDNYNTFCQKIKEIECIKFNNMSKMQKKLCILHFTETISYEFVKIILRYWITNNDKIMFLKEN